MPSINATVLLSLILSSGVAPHTASLASAPLGSGIALIPRHPVSVQPPAKLNPGTAEATSIEQIVAYLERSYFAGISLDDRQRARMRRIVELSISEQKASIAGAKSDQLDSLRVAHLRSRNAALRSILPREEDRARYDANLKRMGAP